LTAHVADARKLPAYSREEIASVLGFVESVGFIELVKFDYSAPPPRRGGLMEGAHSPRGEEHGLATPGHYHDKASKESAMFYGEEFDCLGFFEGDASKENCEEVFRFFRLFLFLFLFATGLLSTWTRSGTGAATVSFR
jgi:hypothetical protein